MATDISLPKLQTEIPHLNSIWVNPTASELPCFVANPSILATPASPTSLNPSTIQTRMKPSTQSSIQPNRAGYYHHSSNIENAANAVAVLDWFWNKIKLNKEAILYNVTQKVIRKAKDWNLVETLLNGRLAMGVKPDNVTFSTLISCARVCNLPNNTVEWFERMPEFGLSPDDVTYSTMIDAYSWAGNVEIALWLYDRARKEKWRIDTVTFFTVIRVHGTSGNFDGALNVYEEMNALGVKPNVVIYNTLLDAIGMVGKPWQVKTIFKEMESNELVPNGITYAALLRTYSRAWYAEDALRVYKEMKEKGFEPNIILYNTLLSMCSNIGLVDEAVEIFEEMERLPAGCKLDSWSYSSLITAYYYIGNVAEAENILNEMLEVGFQPIIFVITSLIQCYGKAKKTNDVVRTFNRLLELSLEPDDRVCGCLLNVLTQTPTKEIGIGNWSC